MDGLRLIEAAFSRKADAELVEAMLAGLRRWVLSGHRGARNPNGGRIKSDPITVGRCLGLPASPERARLLLRDAYLRQAAALLGQGERITWQLACRLHREIRRFLAHEWPCWWALAAPPDHATELDRVLWLATRAGGGKLPGTARRLSQILSA